METEYLKGFVGTYSQNKGQGYRRDEKNRGHKVPKLPFPFQNEVRGQLFQNWWKYRMWKLLLEKRAVRENGGVGVI